jgi:MYXO-CTERM domain-containing protein
MHTNDDWLYRNRRSARRGLCGLAGVLSLPVATLLPSCSGSDVGPEPAAYRVQAEGLGRDGDVNVSVAGQVLNRYAVLGADANPGNTTLTLSNVPGQGVDALMPLVPGDLLLLVQLQGAEISDENSARFGEVLDLGGAGLFEFIEVTSVDSVSNRIVVNSGCGGLKNGYLTRGKTQVVRVPLLRSLTVQTNASIAAKPWDGASGGVIALQVAGNFTLTGNIDASSAGFRGGSQNPNVSDRLAGVGSYYLSNNSQDGGNRGEGIAGSQTDYALIGQYGRGAAANGGGGGNRIAAGGGGGGNGGILANWTGQGVFDTGVTGGSLAWPLDPGNAQALAAKAGGGRGGYTLSDGKLDPTTTAPGAAGWGQDGRRERGGLGGRPLPNDEKSRLFVGGGGGSGDDYKSQSGMGGRGGGLIFIDAAAVSGTGMILANGQAGGSATTSDGGQSGGGGGGAGGSIVLSVPQVVGISLQANGGKGGDQGSASTLPAGPGGGGGGGFVAVANANVSATADGGRGGSTASPDVVKFPRNGASDGQAGTIVRTVSGLFAGAPLCAVADLSVSLSATPEQASRLTPFTLQVRVRNQGPSRTGNIVVPLELPAGVRLTSFAATGWDCTASSGQLRCTLPLLASGEESSFTATVTPALGQSSLRFVVSASAPSTDPQPADNTATLTVNNNDPLDIRFAGGGFGCSVAVGPTAERSRGLLLLGLLLGLGALRLRRRQASSEQ